MDRVRCSICGEDHDLSETELTCDRPEAYFDVPHDEREARVFASEGLTIVDHSTDRARYFVRAVIVIPMRGETSRDGFGWGAWAEVSQGEFARLINAGDEPGRERTPPLRRHARQ